MLTKKINHNGKGIVFDGNDMWSVGNDLARNFVIFDVNNT